MPMSSHSPFSSTKPLAPSNPRPISRTHLFWVFLLSSEQLFSMTHEEDGGPTLWIFLEERPRLRAGFQEEVGAGPSAGRVHPPLCSYPPQATHHHSQHPPAARAAAGQREQLRVPAAPADEVSRWGIRAQTAVLRLKDCPGHRSHLRGCPGQWGCRQAHEVLTGRGTNRLSGICRGPRTVRGGRVSNLTCPCE